jgi:hypothetical protein
MDMPACLRHITRSLACVSCIHAGDGGGGLDLRVMARHGAVGSKIQICRG